MVSVSMLNMDGVPAVGVASPTEVAPQPTEIRNTSSNEASVASLDPLQARNYGAISGLPQSWRRCLLIEVPADVGGDQIATPASEPITLKLSDSLAYLASSPGATANQKSKQQEVLAKGYASKFSTACNQHLRFPLGLEAPPGLEAPGSEDSEPLASPCKQLLLSPAGSDLSTSAGSDQDLSEIMDREFDASLNATEADFPSPSASVPPGLPPPAGSPSHGSVAHAIGDCKPCAWFWKPQGCANGADCRHCHACSMDALKIRKRNKAEKIQRERGSRVQLKLTCFV